MSNLSPKQSRFIDEYLIDFNATRAAIVAGYSEKTAHSIGNENLKKPEIKEEIARRMAELEASSLLTKEMVIKGLLKEAQEEGEGASHSARVSAWAHLGKHLGMFTEKVEHSGAVSISTVATLMDEITDEDL